MKSSCNHKKQLSCDIIGAIDVSLVRRMIDRIEAISTDETVEIIIRINSQGGSVPVALTFAEYIDSINHHVVAYNMAHCDSASILIFAAAKRRIAKQSSSFMFHPPCVHLNGNFTINELSVELNRLRKDTKSMIEFLSKMIQINQMQLKAWMEQGEHIVSARQALKLGIVTEIDRT